MTEFFDSLETRSTAEREADLFDAFPEKLTDIMNRIPGWKSRFAEIDISSIANREALSKIPVMRKPELMDAQVENPPFGGFADESLINGSRIFMSPGPIWEPQAPGPDPWQAARAFHAAGLRAGDYVHCAIGFTMTPGGAILDEGARALGAVTYPAGVGNTEAQVEAIAILKPRCYAGTPDYLQTLIDKAEEMGKDISSIKLGMVSGGALFPSMRAAYKERGILVMQGYATADIGFIAHETQHEGEICEGMICNENLILEIVRPGSDDPVRPGEVGEIVVTSFNKAYPLIRFGTGDMSAIIEEPSPCGRTNMRIKGWMGRADQRTKVKGMFVDPKQIGQLIKSVAGLENARLVVSRDNGKDAMTLQAIGNDLDPERIAEQFTVIAKLKGKVEIVETLPNDGKVIDDQRDYSG
ncbi:MAG: phenylacetate--CoA ligase family protein [Rhizobiaceae bacterium]